MWAGVLIAHGFRAGPEDTATACRHAIFRDPVTGREQSIGEARIAPDGAIRCSGVTYRLDIR